MVMRWSAGFSRCKPWLFLQKGGIALALATFFSVFAFFVMTVFAGNQLAMRFFGVEAIATVTEHSFEMSSCPSRRYRSPESCPSYHVGYAFSVNGQSYAGRHKVDEEFFFSTFSGQSTPVHYMIFKPEWSVLALSHHNFWLVWMAPIFGLLAFNLSKLCRQRFHRMGQMIKLRDHGLRRTAQVVSVIPTTLKVNGLTYKYMVWADDAGKSGESLWQSAWYLPQVGSTITVFADPKGEIPSVWDKDCGGQRPFD